MGYFYRTINVHLFLVLKITKNTIKLDFEVWPPFGQIFWGGLEVVYGRSHELTDMVGRGVIDASMLDVMVYSHVSRPETMRNRPKPTRHHMYGLL